MGTNEMKKPIINPRIGVLFGILAVSTASIFIKFAQQNEVASIVIAAYRLGIAALILSPVVLARQGKEIASLSSNDLRLSLLSGFFLAIHFATWIKSLEYTSVASSVVLVTTTPVWVAIFSPFILKEKVSRVVAIGLLFALAGTFIIAISDICDINNGLECPPINQFFLGEAVLGDFLALSGAWTAAGYVLIGRRIRSKLSLLPYIFLVYSVAALVLIVFMFMSNVQVIGFDSTTYLWLVLLALIPQLMGHSIFNWALGYLPAAFVAVTLLGEPIGSTFLAYIFLGEVPGMIKIIGAILIFGGIMIASKPETPQNKITNNKIK